MALHSARKVDKQWQRVALVVCQVQFQVIVILHRLLRVHRGDCRRRLVLLVVTGGIKVPYYLEVVHLGGRDSAGSLRCGGVCGCESYKTIYC